MNSSILIGLLIPFLGTAFGSGCVFFMKENLPVKTQRLFTGFAAGVMVAASIWSLLIPSIEQSGHLKTFAFLPAASGFLVGILFLLLLDSVIPHFHPLTEQQEGIKSNLSDKMKLMLAVTLHNIPEGIAIGVVFAGLHNMDQKITYQGALALSIGIALQNFPEGAIISMPLQTRGVGKKNAFLLGILSGIVEPLASLFTIGLAGIMIPILPYLLSFAAGAMMYVVVEELVPEMSQGEHSNLGVIAFSIGFVIMMILDIGLG